jgi:hypothetical protein
VVRKQMKVMHISRPTLFRLVQGRSLTCPDPFIKMIALANEVISHTK